MSTFLCVKKLSKVFDVSNASLLALDDVFFSVDRGQIVCIVGPSGCGKTTLLRIISGLIEPTSGSIFINEKSPVDFRNSEGLSFVFQKPLLLPWHNLERNIILPMQIQNKKYCMKDINKLLDILKLTGFNKFYPKELSGGMQQRATIARALITNPKLLLFDEPFNALDETTREQLWTDFRNIWREMKFTAIIITHNIKEAIFLSDQVFVMSKRPGHITQKLKIDLSEDRNSEVFFTPKFSDIYNKIRSCYE